MKKCKKINMMGNCKKCKCSYKSHLIVYYKTKVVANVRENVELKKQMQQTHNANVLAATMIAYSQKYSDELNKEMQTISNIQAQFALYLKEKAILPYNDAFKVLCLYTFL